MSKTTYKLPVHKDTKYTVKGSGLIMDSDNSIRLDAKPIFYNRYHVDPNKYTRVFPDKNVIKLSSNIRFNGRSQYVINGEKYQMEVLSDREFGLINLIENSYDISAKWVYDDEYGRSSENGSVTGSFSTTSGYTSNAVHHKIPLSDYFYLDVYLEYDFGSNSNKITLGYTIDLVFTPESDSSISTYTKAVEYNEIDSKEPIIISVMDGSKEKYHVEVVINSMGVELLSRDAFTSFKDPNSGNYVTKGGTNG